MRREIVDNPLSFGALKMRRTERSPLPIAGLSGAMVVLSSEIISNMGDGWERVFSLSERVREREFPLTSGKTRPTEDCGAVAQVWVTFLDFALRGKEIKEEEKRGKLMTTSYLREHPDCVVRGSWSFIKEILRLEDEQTKEVITAARGAFQALLDGKEADSQDIQEAKRLTVSVFNEALMGGTLNDYSVVPISKT